MGLVLIASVRADTVQLITGQTVSGNVLAYSNMIFDVELQTGATAHYQEADVTRIVFGPQPAQAWLDTGVKDPPEVAVTRFESAAFTVQSDDGQPKQVPAEMVTSAGFGAAAVKSVEIITHGDTVEIARHLVHGKVTVVDFYADWCGPCRMISPFLEQLVKDDHEVVLRKVDVVSWSSPVAQEYGINAIPRIEVYDRAGKITGIVSGVNSTQVKEFVDQAKNAAPVLP
jgi:thiol-disulfide isomerase/thioredoxin